MSRLFICGITCGPEIDKIKDLVNRTKDSVDGFIWTVDTKPITNFLTAKDVKSDKASQECWDLVQFLNDNKKAGKILNHDWNNAHDWQANEWLHCGILKEGDWVWMFDSSESPTDYWLKNIRDYISSFERDNHVASFWSGRPYLFKYSEYLYFYGTPHWGLYGLQGSVLYPKEETKAAHIINKRDLNPAKHYQEHDTKYYLYGRSNIIDAFYGKYGQNVVNYHEQKRREVRKWLNDNFQEVSLKSLEKAFKALDFVDKDTLLKSDIVEVIELEFSLSEYYRRIILKEDFMKDIVPRRERWSFKNFLKTGDGFSDPNYLGTRLKYDEQKSRS